MLLPTLVSTILSAVKTDNERIMTIFWCVVPILLLFFGKAWSSSKIREYYSRSQRALQATVAEEMDEQQPSWITDVSRRAEFTAGLCELSLKKECRTGFWKALPVMKRDALSDPPCSADGELWRAVSRSDTGRRRTGRRCPATFAIPGLLTGRPPGETGG